MKWIFDQSTKDLFALLSYETEDLPVSPENWKRNAKPIIYILLADDRSLVLCQAIHNGIHITITARRKRWILVEKLE